jgi:hypothetical protein
MDLRARELFTPAIIGFCKFLYFVEREERKIFRRGREMGER